MQVNSGKYKGKILNTLESNETRPTLDKVKSAIFNMLGTDVYHARVLDLFSGSGNLGIEALSNHASFCYFIDNNKEAIKIITRNVNSLNFSKDQAIIINKDYNKALPSFKDQEKFDIIFLDPPYHLMALTKIINQIISNNILNKDSYIICESSLNEEITFDQDYLVLHKEKKYGKCKVTILRSV